TTELAESQAREADRRLRTGDSGALCGIPFGVKDLLATAGIPTRYGSPLYRNQVFEFDAAVITKLRMSGAVLVAKLSMLELAGAGGPSYATASIDGPGLNPWNTNYWSGGSSSGSAAAVAAGLVPFAIGSETGGSLTTPAAFCGITGLRPSLGIVSRHGSLMLAPSADKLGPMAHTAADCGRVLAVIAGRDERDPWTVDWRVQRVGSEQFTLGVIANDYRGLDIAQARFDEALGVFRRLGFRLTELTLPNYDYPEIWAPILAAEVASSLDSVIHSESMRTMVDPGQRERLGASATQPVGAYAGALAKKAAATRDVRRLFLEVDALVAPTLLTEAPTIESNLRTEWDRRGHHALLGAIAGVPQVSLPMGFGPTGLPLGLSLTGDLLEDAKILRIAELYQRETDWHSRRPPT
ncbi:MAG: amidase, partial [Actinomycetota bacterium]|nr:amidase [Actinomycetota bacterium]